MLPAITLTSPTPLTLASLFCDGPASPNIAGRFNFCCATAREGINFLYTLRAANPTTPTSTAIFTMATIRTSRTGVVSITGSKGFFNFNIVGYGMK
jgi:hypothetical protein